MDDSSPHSPQLTQNAFSQFIVPFTHHLQPCQSTGPKNVAAYFEPIPSQNTLDFPQNGDATTSPFNANLSLWRKRYFAQDTQIALFERAKWYALNTKMYHSMLQKNPTNDSRDRSEISQFFGAENHNVGLHLGYFESNTDGTTSSFHVIARNVQLVLFEAAPSLTPGNENVMTQCMNSGFLIVTTQLIRKEYLSNQNNPNADEPEKSELSPYPTQHELTQFNEVFRYLTPPFPSHVSTFTHALTDNELFLAEGNKENGEENSHTNESHLAANSKIQDAQYIKEVTGSEGFRPFGDKEKHPLGDTFQQYLGRWLTLLNLPIQENKQMFRLATPQQLANTAKASGLLGIEADKNAEEASLFFYPDNRAFVRSYQEAESAPISSLPLTCSTDEKKPKEYTSSWVNLVNVDKPPEHIYDLASPYEQEWIIPRTYTRWEKFNTLYGFSYHSAVMLCEPCSDPPLAQHFSNQYMDISLLLLYVRVSLFKFSHELNTTTQKAIENGDWAHSIEDFTQLRSTFAAFVNLYRFPLISNQQQAIEMYSKQREIMDIDEMFKEIESEISTTHEFLELQSNSDIQKDTVQLNRTVLFVGLLGVIATLFTINTEVNFFKKLTEKASLAESQYWLSVSVPDMWALTLVLCLFALIHAAKGHAHNKQPEEKSSIYGVTALVSLGIFSLSCITQAISDGLTAKIAEALGKASGIYLIGFVVVNKFSDKLKTIFRKLRLKRK